MADGVAIFRDGNVITVASVEALRDGAVRQVRLAASDISAAEVTVALKAVRGVGSLLNYDQIAPSPGYTQARVFVLVDYLLMSIASIAWGAAAAAGDEESGQL